MPGNKIEGDFVAKEQIEIWVDEDGSKATFLTHPWTWIAHASRRSLNDKKAVKIEFGTFAWHGVAVSLIPHEEKLLIELRLC